MAHQDELERYEATEARDITRLLRTLRPPAREVQVPPDVDLTIRAEIWKPAVRRQVATLLAMARCDLIQVVRQALAENPLLEAVSDAEDEDRSTGEEHAQGLTAAAGDLTDAVERYATLWQACLPDGWDADEFTSQTPKALSASERPSGSPEALVPDVIVTKVGHDYRACLNAGGMPWLRLGATSRGLGPTGHGGGPAATPELDDHLRAAVWLLRSLEHRREMLLQVAAALVTRQRDWLDHGLAYVKPLALTEMAKALGLHASTVRLVVANKYLSTADGIIALTAFFPHGIESSGGEARSSLMVHETQQLIAAEARTRPPTDWISGKAWPTGGLPISPDEEQLVRQAIEEQRDRRRLTEPPPLDEHTIKDRITQLIAAEDPAQPLTDQQLVEALAAEHLHIARRTVTQYRRELQLPPAHRRQPHGSTAGASRLPPEDEERVRQVIENPANFPFRQAWLQSRPTVPDPVGEMRAAYRDLQTALAHPQLRPAVLLALRAFAQAAQAGAPPAPAADAMAFPFVELGSSSRAGPDAEARSPVHDLNDLMHQAIRRVVALLGVEGVSIILLDEARQELYFKVADDPRAGHEPRLREVRFPATQGIAGWVLREGRSEIVPDVDHDPRFYRGADVQAGTGTRSLVCVPLRTQERIIGVLQAINKRQGHFTADDVRRLEAFADQFACALEQARMVQEQYNFDVQQLIAEAERLANSMVPFDTLIGKSLAMQAVSRLVERVLPTTATVLLTGERGTGQDFIARLLHAQGPRAQGPFVAVNCAVLPETWLEAQLFGAERGALTGATQRQSGRVELAAGGTLYLDEIAEMSVGLQGKLLRVLQEKTFTRMGGTETLPADARIVAATHQDLERLMAEGRFRRDLYDRLNVYPIALPPLREHQEDIVPLAMQFVEQYRQEFRKDIVGISEEAMRWLERYLWPGNIRELESVIEQAVARCQGPTVTAQDLPQRLREPSGAPGAHDVTITLPPGGLAITLPPGGLAMADLEKQLIQQALDQADRNTSHAAKLLGLSRSQLRTRMRQYGLEDA